MLWVVGSQDESNIEDGFQLVIANQQEQGAQGSLPALLAVVRFNL
jgi:hypothetical protein